MYKLIGSYTSPYVRKMRLILMNLNINFDFQSINYLEANDGNFLRKVNPINKIPVLIVNDETTKNEDMTIYDSRVIYNYLAKKYGQTPLTIADENILSAIDGAMDTSINLFSLRRGGMDLNANNPFIERQKERVDLILNFLSPYISKLDPQKATDWNFVSMSLYSYLYWGKFREMLDFSNRPECEKFLENFSQHKGVKETIPA